MLKLIFFPIYLYSLVTLSRGMLKICEAVYTCISLLNLNAFNNTVSYDKLARTLKLKYIII